MRARLRARGVRAQRVLLQTLQRPRAAVPAAPGFLLAAMATAWVVALASDSLAFRLDATVEALAPATGLFLFASILIGVLGIGWGILGDSRIVLFDGVYTLFGTALSGLSLLAAWVASRDATEAYPFGREAIIPVAIVMQGAALLARTVHSQGAAHARQIRQAIGDSVEAHGGCPAKYRSQAQNGHAQPSRRLKSL